MEPMMAGPGWPDVALRLACALVAGGLIGLNRGAGGRPVGLRTTMLVCLAATLAMLQADVLLDTASGARLGSGVQLDVARLPLGILSGIGFIGAGAILRRGDMVRGVTTAATLWMVTVLGLCFGGGQIGLGAVGALLTLVVLWVLRHVERRIERDRRGTLTLVTRDAAARAALRHRLVAGGYRVASEAVHDRRAEPAYLGRYDLRWRAARGDPAGAPAILAALADDPAVVELRWQPGGREPG